MTLRHCPPHCLRFSILLTGGLDSSVPNLPNSGPHPSHSSLMSTSFSQAEAAADAETSNREHHGSRAKPTPGIENRASAKSSSQMASRANAPAGESNGDGDEVIPTDFQEQDVFQPSALRSTPSEVTFDDGIGNHGAQRPVEPSIWGWEAPLKGQEQSSSSIHYEPQGELLQERRDHQTSRDEFSIPHAVSASRDSKYLFPYAGFCSAE